jgi:hypothetical protein
MSGKEVCGSDASKGGPMVFNILAKIVNPYLKQKGKTVILIWRRKKPAI